MIAQVELLHPRVQAFLHEHPDMTCRAMACDPALADTAAFCEHYGFAPEQAANAIIVATKSDPPQTCCCLVLATHKLDVNKKVATLLGTKKVSFASSELTVKLTDMQIGGVTPLGIEGMPIYIDSAVMEKEAVIIGGGNRSSKISIAPSEMLKIPGAEVVEGLGLPRV